MIVEDFVLKNKNTILVNCVQSGLYKNEFHEHIRNKM